MTRLRDSTKMAQKMAWPMVKAALAAQAEPVVISKFENSRQVRSNIRFVVEETIEALAAAGLLRTPADANVIGKAEAWFDSYDAQDEEVFEKAEDDLLDAVEKMLDEVKDRPTP